MQFRDGVRNCGPHGGKAFDSAGGTAGQIDDQGALANACQGARNDGGCKFLATGSAHGLSETWKNLLDNSQGSIGCHIARRDAGATSRKHKVRLIAISEVSQGLNNLILLVGDNSGTDNFNIAFAKPCREGWSAGIYALGS